MTKIISNGLNPEHRRALYEAVSRIDKISVEKEHYVVLIGTKNLIRGLYPGYRANRMIIYLTGFGRLFTEYGLFGKAIFSSLILLYKFKRNLAFIVENNDDALVIKKLMKNRKIHVTNSSGLATTGFTEAKKYKRNKKITFGYLARFDNSKQTQRIIDLAAQLPNSFTLMVAGFDAGAKDFTSKFITISDNKPNVIFLGALEQKVQISNFFHKIDVLLYPTNREGLPMTLVEAAFHHVDFITSNVAGCKEIAKEFEREVWKNENFTLNNILTYKPKKYTKAHLQVLKKYLHDHVERGFYGFLKETLINKVQLFDISNTNQLHRRALLQATNQINSQHPKNKTQITIFVGTRNMIKAVPKTIFGSGGNIIIIVGFGRLYTEYGFFGRFIFNSIVWLHDKTNAFAFIVEHETDKKILENFVKSPVYTTHGSGLNVTGFRRDHIPRDKKLRIGYLSRFHVSKGSHEILKAAKNLPGDRELVIAGWDIKGNKYHEAFKKISINKQNVTFLGRLNSQKEVSKFFNSIDLFLSPSIREGGNIALQEAIWHKVPFMTTNVPGCDVLAKIFDCPALNMEDFGNKVVDKDLATLNIDTSDWDEKIKPFLTENVEKEYFACLSEVIKNIDG